MVSTIVCIASEKTVHPYLNITHVDQMKVIKVYVIVIATPHSKKAWQGKVWQVLSIQTFW